MSGHVGMGTAAREPGGGTGPDRPEPRLRGRLLRDVLLLFGLAVLFTAPAKAFVARAFLVPAGSMADMLRPGDPVLVNKLVYHFGGVDRGDIVVFVGTGSWGPVPPRHGDAQTLAGRARVAALRGRR